MGTGRAAVGRFHDETSGQLALDGEVEVLHVGRLNVPLHAVRIGSGAEVRALGGERVLQREGQGIGGASREGLGDLERVSLAKKCQVRTQVVGSEEHTPTGAERRLGAPKGPPGEVTRWTTVGGRRVCERAWQARS